MSSATNRAAILALLNGESRVPGSEEKPGHGDLATRHPPPATVVLVHGLWMNGMEMCLLRRRLGKAGFATQRFSYPTVRSDIAANAARLQQFLSGLDADTVHFVGHSLGGLLILRLFADFPEQRPGRIVLLGTPYAGSATARNLARRAWGRRRWAAASNKPCSVTVRAGVADAISA